jgi:hypothetical protein
MQYQPQQQKMPQSKDRLHHHLRIHQNLLLVKPRFHLHQSRLLMRKKVAMMFSRDITALNMM